jgi:hypothetical protein
VTAPDLRAARLASLRARVDLTSTELWLLDELTRLDDELYGGRCIVADLERRLAAADTDLERQRVATAQRLALQAAVGRHTLELIAGMTEDYREAHEGLIYRLATLALIEMDIADQHQGPFG